MPMNFLGIPKNSYENIQEMFGRCLGNVENNSKKFPADLWVVYNHFPGFRGKLQRCLGDVFRVFFKQFSVKCPGRFPDKVPKYPY